MEIIKSIILLGAMGFLFGAVLAYASKKFAVEVDERVEQILEVLPGANCGGCGYPGCAGLANAISEGKADINGCPVGGSFLGGILQAHPQEPPEVNSNPHPPWRR